MVEELLTYYDQHKRNLPWRKSKDPYCIWISEIMAQQTRIETVIDYYLRFIRQYPDVESLADASLEEVYKLWQGLGYYSRAKNLLNAAKMIVSDYHGIFPVSYEALLSLPGIGEYTAAAIASMAYDAPYVAIDGNFFRVFTRFYCLDMDISKNESKIELRNMLTPLLPERSGDFNQAVMDLGATICLGDHPKCSICPLKQECQAHLNKKEELYPYNSKKQKIINKTYTLFIIKIKECYVLHKREDKGLLAGLYEFKNKEGLLSMEEVSSLFPGARITKKEERSHHFTHQTWNMYPYLIETDSYSLKENEVLLSKKEILKKYSVPKCFNQFFDLL